MKVNIGGQVLLVKLIDEWGPALRDVTVSKQLSDHGSVFVFRQRVKTDAVP